MASRSLSDLDPKPRELCMRWIDACKKAGYEVLVYCTYRSKQEQDDLYRIGRDIPGKKVTNAKGGESYHQYRCAWDWVPLLGGKPQWNNEDMYKRCAEIGEAMGIEWAGRWKRFREMAHFQDSGGLTIADLLAGKRPEGWA